MSISKTPTVDISIPDSSVTSVTAVSASSIVPTVQCEQEPIDVVSNEYSIVGDRFYIGTNHSETPAWLTSLLEQSIGSAVNGALTDYNSLVQDVRNAVDSIDVAKNRFTENINFDVRVDSIIGTHLSTFNASLGAVSSTVVDLTAVVATNEKAAVTRISDLNAELSEDISSRITNVQQAVSTMEGAFADSITALTSSFADQESNQQGTADVVSNISTYVGLKPNGTPTGLGVLSRINTLEKQTDGTVDILAHPYSVMLGIEEDNSNVDNDLMRFSALPYVLWTTLESFGAPTGSLRSYTDYSTQGNPILSVDVLEGTLCKRVDFTDVDLDKYYEYSAGLWSAVTEAYYLGKRTLERDAHIGDVSIHYEVVDGVKKYLRSYKFIKAEVDESSPVSTDTDGYTWAVVSDTDSRAIYVSALEAHAMADGKISQFYAWSDGEEGSYPQDVTVVKTYVMDEDGQYLDSNGVVTVEPTEYVASEYETIDSTNVKFWLTNSPKTLYKKGSQADWSDKTAVPLEPGGGAYISEGDILAVFDPITVDSSVYRYDGENWLIQSPDGIVSKSRWAIELDNAVFNAHGHVAKSISSVKALSEAFANDRKLEVINTFAYDSKIVLDDKTYRTGFGLKSTASADLIEPAEDGNPAVFDSEFWVNSESFVIRHPVTGKSAVFRIGDNGSLQLGLENTEATKNEVRGEYENTRYYKGDIVQKDGSSWSAIRDTDTVPGADLTETSDWLVLASRGKSVDFLFIRYEAGTTPPDPVASPVLLKNKWYTDVNTVPAGAGSLWTIKEITDSHGNKTYEGKSIADQEIVVEKTIYSNSTSTDYDPPTGSYYDFEAGKLHIESDGLWYESAPNIQNDGDKIYAYVAAISGNRTQDNVPVSWENKFIYSSRTDGARGAGQFTFKVSPWYDGSGSFLDFFIAETNKKITPVNLDIITLINNNDTSTQATYRYLYDKATGTGSWETFALHIHGSLLVDGTVEGKALRAETVVAGVSIALGEEGNEKFKVGLDGIVKAEGALLKGVTIRDSENNLILDAQGGISTASISGLSESISTSISDTVGSTFIKNLITPSVVAGSVFAADIQGDINSKIDIQYIPSPLYTDRKITKAQYDAIDLNGHHPQNCEALISGNHSGYVTKFSPYELIVDIADSGVSLTNQRYLKVPSIAFPGSSGSNNYLKVFAMLVHPNGSCEVYDVHNVDNQNYTSSAFVIKIPNYACELRFFSELHDQYVEVLDELGDFLRFEYLYGWYVYPGNQSLQFESYFDQETLGYRRHLGDSSEDYVSAAALPILVGNFAGDDFIPESPLVLEDEFTGPLP